MGLPNLSTYRQLPDGYYIKQSDLSGPYVWDGTNMSLVDGEGDTGAVYVSKSATIVTGGVAQQLMAANAARKGYKLQNQSNGPLWINVLGAATADNNSLQIPAGAYYEPPPKGIPLTAISIIGATTGQAFFAREY